jgi:chromosome segregation ATPase
MPEYSLSAEVPAGNQGGAPPALHATTIQDNMARIALLLDQLTKAVVDLRERTAKTESQLSEIKPYLDAIKIHVDSLPNALREARRSDLAVQKLIEQLSSRVADMESRLKGGSVKG